MKTQDKTILQSIISNSYVYISLTHCYIQTHSDSLTLFHVIIHVSCFQINVQLFGLLFQALVAETDMAHVIEEMQDEVQSHAFATQRFTDPHIYISAYLKLLSSLTTDMGSMGIKWASAPWSGDLADTRQSPACALWALLPSFLPFMIYHAQDSDLHLLAALFVESLACDAPQIPSALPPSSSDLLSVLHGAVGCWSSHVITAQQVSNALLTNDSLQEGRPLLRALVDMLIRGCYSALVQNHNAKNIFRQIRRADSIEDAILGHPILPSVLVRKSFALLGLERGPTADMIE